MKQTTNQKERHEMKLLTSDIKARLLENRRLQEEMRERGQGAEIDFFPVIKLFTPDGAATWLLTELDPEDADIAFGLCDLGMGCPELGSVRISELEAVRGWLGLPVERDRHFKAEGSLGDYADLAREIGRIKA
jgi:hypothetical protein